MAFGGVQNTTKKGIYQTIIEGIVLYNSEVWEIKERQSKRLQALEVDALKISFRISKLRHISNNVIKEKMRV